VNFVVRLFVDFWKKILGLETEFLEIWNFKRQNSWKYGISKIWELSDLETQLFGTISSRGKE